MRQSRHFLISITLVLMQILAPWVHAHSDGGQEGGLLHIPGLEFLNSGSDAYTQAQAGATDIIVACPCGIRGHDFKLGLLADDSPAIILPVDCLNINKPAAQAVRGITRYPPPIPVARVDRSGFPPRAPPLSISSR